MNQAREEDVVITNHGKAVVFIRGFQDDADFLEHKLMTDPRFAGIMERARRDHRDGRVTQLEDLPE